MGSATPLAAVGAATAAPAGLGSNLYVARIRARDVPDLASWQEMKVRHPRGYRRAGRAAATANRLCAVNHASCRRAAKPSQLHLRTSPVIEGALEDRCAVTVSREAVEHRRSDLLAERERLTSRLAEIDREVAVLAEQLELLTGSPGNEGDAAEGGSADRPSD